MFSDKRLCTFTLIKERDMDTIKNGEEHTGVPKRISLSGSWDVRLSDGERYRAMLPGTLDTNSIGHKDSIKGPLHQDENYVENEALSSSAVIATRFTRKHTYEGKAVFSKIFDAKLPKGMRLFLRAERSRVLSLTVDGKKVPALQGSLSTPYLFEVTDILKSGSLIELMSDNSYEGLPHDNITYSSAATDETQTNWNGITGEFDILVKENTFLESVLVRPKRSGEDGSWILDIAVTVDSREGFEGKLLLDITRLQVTKEIEVKCGPGRTTINTGIKIFASHDLLWDEAEGRLLSIRASILNDEYETSFGIRSFKDMDGHLCLNGRRIFLRGEANCAVFPEEGHPPLDRDSWRQIIKTYMGYGVNCLRFHSHCPPEAAFLAADELGMLMQPELSHWNPRDAFSDEAASAYYARELAEILKTYCNHPSFVMLAFGNELQARGDGLDVVKRLLDLCHRTDSTRLYAFSSNPFYGEKGADHAGDYFTAMWYRDFPMRATFDGMRGYLNNDYPDARHDYSETVRELRKEYSKPVFSFEVGQYEILPDFKELKDFKGVTSPENIELIKEKVIGKGLYDTWEKRVEATGELALLSYSEEVEAALRTEDYSGISLLGLQDFPGQGTALVGMLNSHLRSKPYSFARADRFKSFFQEALPLAYLEKYTYVEDDELMAPVRFANYSKGDVAGKLRIRIANDGKELLVRDLTEVTARQGHLDKIGEIKLPLSELSLKSSTCLTLDISFGGYSNSYRLYVYTEGSQNPEKPADVYETRCLDEGAGEVLENGGIVFLAPDSDKESLPNSIKSTFTTDFWSVGTFSSQEGSMGLLIDNEHPLFKDYPTSFYTDRQWFMQSLQRALILPDGIGSIVTVMDSYAYLRNMGMLLEFNCLKGRVFISTMGLHNLQNYPECRALLSSIYRYLSSDDFAPSREIAFENDPRGWSLCDILPSKGTI